MALSPLSWGFGIGTGVVLALLLGPSVPGWGLSLAFPAVALLISGGALYERDGDEMRHGLRFVAGLTIGMLAGTIPVTLIGLIRMLEAGADDPQIVRRVEEARHALTGRWAVIALALPGSVATLWLRHRRAQANARSASATASEASSGRK